MKMKCLSTFCGRPKFVADIFSKIHKKSNILDTEITFLPLESENIEEYIN